MIVWSEYAVDLQMCSSSWKTIKTKNLVLIFTTFVNKKIHDHAFTWTIIRSSLVNREC